MREPIRILMLEGSPVDAELAIRELSLAGVAFVHERVEDELSFTSKLLDYDPDIILSNYDLPGIDGLSALRIRNNIRKDVPFIFLSGTLGEERAVDAVVEGASDYVLKDRISRLAPAFHRAMRESQERADRVRAEASLREFAAFQELIAALSTRFANLSDSALENELRNALEKIGVFVHAERAFLFPCSIHGDAEGEPIDWRAEGIEPLPLDRSSFPCSSSTWLFSRLGGGEPLSLSESEARLTDAGVVSTSFLSVPMMVAGTLIGFVGFSPYSEKTPTESEALLKISGEIFGSAIARRRSNEALQQEKELISRVVDTTASLLIVLDSEGCFKRINPAFTQTTGFTIEDLNQRHLWDIAPPASEEPIRQAFAKALQGSVKDCSHPLMTKEHDERQIVWQATSIRSGDVTYVVGTGVDVTQRHRIEKERAKFKSQLEQTTRLDGLGRLAATITHEFNNVLMGIKPFTRVMEKKWPGDPGIAEVANQIAKAVLRGERITREILRFTRPAETALIQLDLTKWLTTFVSDTRGQMTERIVIAAELPEDPVMIDADPIPLHQAMSNLLLNARDAMPDGGEILITLEHDASVGFETEDHRAFVQLTVRDNGRGIPAEILSHIFEPLFTTKKSGTGLGLAVTYQIIHAHHGYIFAESELGQGTAFHLFFPVHTNDEDERAHPSPVAEMRADMSIV